MNCQFLYRADDLVVQFLGRHGIHKRLRARAQEDNSTFSQNPSNVPSIVVNRTLQRCTSVVNIPKPLHSDEIVPFEEILAHIGTFQMLGWVAAKTVNVKVQCL